MSTLPELVWLLWAYRPDGSATIVAPYASRSDAIRDAEALERQARVNPLHGDVLYCVAEYRRQP